ncbi:hypothetical protein [Robbsia andropogonis]|uniref:hypothetical protein n=1 Tax=Robbsia andropogonis TaxID=28092 RepID=UPI002A6ACD50|nr:hypothetical protein [Robbsia andropogonis]
MWGLMALAFFSQMLPNIAVQTVTGIDGSFPYTLNRFAFGGLQFGTDLIYTYGPLGFLLRTEDIGHHLIISYAFWIVLFSVVSLLLAHKVQSSGNLAVTGALFLLTFVFVRYIDQERAITCTVIFLLLVFFDTQYRRNSLIAAGVLTSIGAMLRFPIGIECTAMIAVSCLVPFKAKRIAGNAVTAALAVAGSFVIVWVLLQNKPSSIWPYLTTSMQIVSGYSVSMSRARELEWDSLLWFLASIAIVLAMTCQLSQKAKIAHAALVSACTLFMGWKHGVVRYDGHILALISISFFLGLTLVLIRFTDGNSASSGPTSASVPIQRSVPSSHGVMGDVVMALLLGMLCFTQNEGLKSSGIATGRAPIFSKFALQSMGGVRDEAFPTWNSLQRLVHYQRYKAEIAAHSATQLVNYQLTPAALALIGGAPVDVYSSDLGLIAANRTLFYDPKPVFQHFNAFTSTLDRLNADFFSSNRRPAFLLTYHDSLGSTSGVDDRHQFFDDPITLPRIINDYSPAYFESDQRQAPVGILKYSPAVSPRLSALTLQGTVATGWNKAVALPTLPASAILYAKVDIKTPFLSKIKNLLFRLSPIDIVYSLSDGTERRYRLMPTHAADGVWASPLIENYQQFYDMLSNQAPLVGSVEAIRFETPNPDEYGQEIKITWASYACHGLACSPADTRLPYVSVAQANAQPLPLTAPVDNNITVATNQLSAVDVFMSNYGTTPSGTVTLRILSEDGYEIRETTINADSIADNTFIGFRFASLENVKGMHLTLEISYQPLRHDMLAVWQSHDTRAGFIYRAYGH